MPHKIFIYRFEPQEDITTWELARLLALLVNTYPSRESVLAAYGALPPECRRHLVEVTN